MERLWKALGLVLGLGSWWVQGTVPVLVYDLVQLLWAEVLVKKWGDGKVLKMECLKELQLDWVLEDTQENVLGKK
jgi:hypothetical protein